MLEHYTSSNHHVVTLAALPAGYLEEGVVEFFRLFDFDCARLGGCWRESLAFVMCAAAAGL